MDTIKPNAAGYYIVHGVVAVRTEQEAIDLMATGAFFHSSVQAAPLVAVAREEHGSCPADYKLLVSFK